tara:strand:+ start:67 stop:306 length:240 start_codon:yes stop_codon:yes gene_type:complete
METKQIFIAGIILGFLLLFFIELKLRKIPIEPQKRVIGGCAGTRYGCCPDSRKACRDKKCSNCGHHHRHHHRHHHELFG